MRRAAKVLLALLVVIWLGTEGRTQTTRIDYIVTDLGTLGGPSSEAWGINNAGQIVGRADLTPGQTTQFYRAFIYENGTMTDLGTITACAGHSWAFDINEAGRVAGWSCTAAASMRAFLWSGGVMTDLGTLGGTNSSAHGINNAGDVVGDAALRGDAATHAYVYRNGVMESLGTIGEGGATWAESINDSGAVVGAGWGTAPPQRYSHAFLYTDGTMTDLTPGPVCCSHALAVNNAGKVVGQAFDHAFLYSGGEWTNLGNLPNGAHSEAIGINNHDVIVGRSALGYAYWHAFRYDNGVMIDLNDRIPDNPEWDLNVATDINDVGQIVGIGTIGGQTHAFLLTPVQHTVTITSGPAGTPNPVAPGGTVNLSVTATDSMGHDLSYAWTAACTLGSNGSFSSTTAQNPTWTPPAGQQSCTIQVTVSDPSGLSETGSYSQGVMCSYDISAATTSIPNGGGSGAVTVMTQGGCPWTAVSLSSDLVVTGPASGTGSATVTYAVAAYGGTTPRRLTLRVAGRDFTITQAGTVVPVLDLNRDGYLDFLWHHQGDGRISGWLMNSTTLADGTLLTPGQVPDTNWKAVGTGDLDGDGQFDIVWQNIADGRTSAWLMNGLTMREGTLFSIPQVPDTNWRICSVGDLNGDGRADLIWQHRGEGWISAWLMNGVTVLSGTLLSPSQVPDTDWWIVGSADFDRNGSRDLVWHHQGDGRIAIWFMNGTTLIDGTLTNPAQVPDLTWKIRAVGDLNGDGYPDFIWQNAADGRISVWLMKGLNLIDGTLLSPSVVPDTNWQVVGPR